jgi:hypothetical protein
MGDELARHVLLEGAASEHDLVDEHSERPEVGLGAVLMGLHEDLWSQVLLGPAREVADKLRGGAHVGHAEVREVGEPVVVEHDVLGLRSNL